MTYNEFLKNHGDCEVKFWSYYKYCFTFIPIEDNEKLEYVCVSGSDNTYRFEVMADKAYTIKELEPSIANFKDGKYMNFDY